MNLYHAEIVGKVPPGLTHNDVYASIVQMVNEKTIVESSYQHRHRGGIVSVVVIYHGLNDNEAKATVTYAAKGVVGLSADIIGPRKVK